MEQVENVLERPKLYYNIDGVGELGIGFMLLAYALLGWLQLHSSPNSAWNQMYGFFLYCGVMVAIIHFGSKAIKNRITYWRTGFVDYRPRDKYWIPLGLGLAVSTVFSVGLYVAMLRHSEMSLLVPLAGVAIAACYVRFTKQARWKWSTFGAMALSVLVIAALPTEVAEAFANHRDLTPVLTAKVVGAYGLMFAVYGALFMISGGISFWLYLRHTQPAAQEVE